MIDREQLARVLDPDAWNLPESIGTQLYRRLALERAERLLSDPRWAVLQLPEPHSVEVNGMQVWELGVDRIVCTAFGVYIEVTRTAAYGGPVAAQTALEIGAAILAASRQAQTQQTTEEQNGA